jgi:hypothetical protein
VVNISSFGLAGSTAFNSLPISVIFCNERIAAPKNVESIISL